MLIITKWNSESLISFRKKEKRKLFMAKHLEKWNSVSVCVCWIYTELKPIYLNSEFADTFVISKHIKNATFSAHKLYLFRWIASCISTQTICMYELEKDSSIFVYTPLSWVTSYLIVFGCSKSYVIKLWFINFVSFRHTFWIIHVLNFLPHYTN